MPSDDPDGILQLLEQANSLEEFLLELDTPQRRYEVISALDGEGRIYILESDLGLSEIDSLEVGIAKKLYEYLHREPPEKHPQEIRH